MSKPTYPLNENWKLWDSTDFHSQKLYLRILGSGAQSIWMQFNLKEELLGQFNIVFQIWESEGKAIKNLVHHLKSFQVLLSFLRFSVTM